MPKKKPKREDYQQIARRVLDTIAPNAEPANRRNAKAKRKTAKRKPA